MTTPATKPVIKQNPLQIGVLQVGDITLLGWGSSTPPTNGNLLPYKFRQPHCDKVVLITCDGCTYNLDIPACNFDICALAWVKCEGSVGGTAVTLEIAESAGEDDFENNYEEGAILLTVGDQTICFTSKTTSDEQPNTYTVNTTSESVNEAISQRDGIENPQDGDIYCWQNSDLCVDPKSISWIYDATNSVWKEVGSSSWPDRFMETRPNAGAPTATTPASMREVHQYPSLDPSGSDGIYLNWMSPECDQPFRLHDHRPVVITRDLTATPVLSQFSPTGPRTKLLLDMSIFNDEDWALVNGGLELESKNSGEYYIAGFFRSLPGVKKNDLSYYDAGVQRNNNDWTIKKDPSVGEPFSNSFYGGRPYSINGPGERISLGMKIVDQITDPYLSNWFGVLWIVRLGSRNTLYL